MKAQGLQGSTSYFDTFLSDVVDVVYYTAVTEWVFDPDSSTHNLPKLFNKEEEWLTKILRNIYVKHDQASNLKKIQKIQLEGANPEEYMKTLIQLHRLDDTFNLSEDEVKLAMDHFKMKPIPKSPFSANSKSVKE